MRGFWRTLAYMAEDAGGFNEKLSSAAGFVVDENLLDGIQMTANPKDPRVFDLKKQPTPAILEAIDQILRSRSSDLRLFAYELAEVNRIAYITRSETPPHGSLKRYWSGLGEIGPANRENVSFMEVVGALAVDSKKRYGFAVNGESLSPWFDVSGEQEAALRGVLQPNSDSDNAAKEYFDSSWPSKTCESIVVPWMDWTHFNG